MIARGDALALALAGAVAVLVPLILLRPAGTSAPRAQPADAAPLAMPSPPPVAALYDRALFGAATAEDAALPADAPQLIGVAGRLGQDAVALVRGSEGTTRALRIGESVDGWQLASLAIDAAFFTRGAQRVRVPLPTDQ
jgi:hypothetical protein